MNLDTLPPLIVGEFPELANSNFTLLTTGWDSVAVDVDDRLIFRFPRCDDAREALIAEARLLSVVRPHVTLPVPDLNIHVGPPFFSWHQKIRGEHLLSKQYALLSALDRQRLAADMALFYAQLHGIDAHDIEAAGAKPIGSWLAAEQILSRACPLLTPPLRAYAERTIEAWQQLPPDPQGTIYGFFDGHGWNMAFDHDKHQLNGIYDFADSGFGPLHQEFIYSNWIARDLTERIIGEYERLMGFDLDRSRIELLGGVIRLSELAEFADDAERRDEMLQNVVDWVSP